MVALGWMIKRSQRFLPGDKFMSDKPSGNWRRFFFRFILPALPLLFIFKCFDWICDPDYAWMKWVLSAVCSLATMAALWAAVFLIRWLCCWRNLRRCLIAVGCFAVLVAAFYLEENWRGKRAWEKFKHKWEAKGEKFKLTELAPPPVPDDQNFALTPIVASCYSDQIDRRGHQLVPANTNVINRLKMDLYREGEYPDNLRSNSWQKAIPTDLKVWQQYYRTPPTNSVTNEFPIAAQPQSPAADVLLALSKYDSAIEELRQASQLPYSRFPLAYDNDNPAMIMLPHLAKLKACALTIQLRTSAELQLDETVKALADVKLALRLTDSIRNEPILIDHLVRIAIFQTALTPIWESLAEHRWTDAQLLALDAELVKLDFLADYKLAMRGEMGEQSGICDFLRKKSENMPTILGGVLGGPICVHDGDPPFIQRLVYYVIPDGWLYQNQVNCARWMVNFCIPLANSTNRTFSVNASREGEKDLLSTRTPTSIFNILKSLLLPSLGGCAKKFSHAQTSVDLARVAIALERYRLAKGGYPETLDALAPQFIIQVPHDVIGGQPLHYRREATSDRFVLYSIGWNEKDDGGTVVLHKNSSTGRVDITEGDWVWRYPAQ